MPELQIPIARIAKTARQAAIVRLAAASCPRGRADERKLLDAAARRDA